MSEAKSSSFLAGVKSELVQLFADTYDQISAEYGESVPEVIPEAMQRLQKKAWELVERGLKTSYLNGRKAANAPERRPTDAHDPSAVTDSRTNPFRKS
jgi:hypothetical protein